MRFLIFVIVLSFQLIPNAAFAKANTLDISTLTQSPILLSSYLGVLEDSTGNLTLADVQKEDVAQRFQTDLSTNKPLNMSYTSSAYWLRLEIENNSDKPIERVLDVNHPLLKNLDFYFQIEKQNYQSVHTGYSQPFESRAYESRIFAFPIVLPAKSHHALYLRVQTPNAMIFPVFLWEPNDFHKKERNEYSAQAIYFGLVIAIGLLNVIFAIFLREFDYLLYVCMMIFLSLTFIGNRGLGTEFIWQDSPWLTQIAPLSFGSIALASQLFFVRRMLDTRTFVPKIDFVLKLFICVQLCVPVVLLFAFQFAKFVPIILAISASLVLIVSVLGIQKGKRNAYFLFTAFSLLAIGVIGNAMLVFALVPTNFFTVHSSQIGSALELIVFTFLLIDRYQLISEEKQTKSMQLLVAHDENELLNLQVNHMQKLESIGRLTSGIAHDFNNILACMLGYNEMNKEACEDINDDGLKIEIKNNIHQIDSAGHRATDLIKKMMLYCRQENDPVKTSSTELAQEVILDVLDMLRPALTSRIQIDFAKCEIDNSCGTCFKQKTCETRIQIESIDLHQILTNLAINARDAMKEHGDTITFSAAKVINVKAYCVACAALIDGDFVELCVSDNGSGINPDIIHRLFDPFFTTKPQGEGTGLGLSAVSGLVHKSGGHILIDSNMTEENHGTTFKLLFPPVSN